MNVWNGLDSLPPDFGVAVASIGNYDGVHLGHQRILAGVVDRACAEGRRSLLVTFEPHPLAVVAPSRRPLLLQTRRQKLDALEELGLDGVLVVRFDAQLAALSGTEFLREVLLPRVHLSALHVGHNFRFGHGRSGDVALLERIGRESGIDIVDVPQVSIDGETISSSAIRSAVEEGSVEHARRMLGRPFAVDGVVVRGEGRGRTLEFPTANVQPENEILPRRGVYVTETSALAARFPSITNVGVRPTFGPSSLTVETHLLDFDEDLYGRRIEIRFVGRLRDEMTFAGPSELADQIARDRAAALAWFERSSMAS